MSAEIRLHQYVKGRFCLLQKVSDKVFNYILIDPADNCLYLFDTVKSEPVRVLNKQFDDEIYRVLSYCNFHGNIRQQAFDVMVVEWQLIQTIKYLSDYVYQ